METLLAFWNQYGTDILYGIITAFAAYLGVVAKNLFKKFLDDKTKRDVAKTVVQAVEQIYKDLHGEEKLNMAIASMSEMLSEKGITISEIEIRMLLEAAVSEFNEAFNKPEKEKE